MRTNEEIKKNSEQTANGQPPLRPLKTVRMSDVKAAKAPLPSTAMLATTEWRVIVTLGEHGRLGKSCASIKFKKGELGYARRNGFQTDYIQVVCPTSFKSRKLVRRTTF